MEVIYINPQNSHVERLGGKAKAKIRRKERKFLQVITWPDDCDKGSLAQESQIIESLFLQNC